MAHLLTQEQIKQFNDDGFLVVSKFFTTNELQPIMDDIDRLVDDLARDLHSAGKIQDLCSNEGFYTRLTKIEQQFPGSAVLLHKKGLLPESIANLWSSEKLLDVIQQVLGPEISGHPVWYIS